MVGMCAGSISWLRKAAHNKQKRENMIIRLHGEEVAHASRGTPSFEDDFVDSSDDSLREEFLELLDKAASTAQKGTHADQALGASIVAAGSISVVTTKVDATPRQESKALLSEAGAPSSERAQFTTANEAKGPEFDATTQSPVMSRSFDSSGKDSGKERAFETSGDPKNSSSSDESSNIPSSGEVSLGMQSLGQGESSPSEPVEKADVPQTEDSFLIPLVGQISTSETSEVGTDTLAQVGEGVTPQESVPIAETSLEGTQVNSPLETAKIADSVERIPADGVATAAISAEGVSQAQPISSDPAMQGGTPKPTTVEVTSKGGGDLAQLLASLKQEQITLRQDEGSKKVGEITNPFFANAIPLLQRPDASVKLAMLKQSFEQIKGVISDVKGAQGTLQSLGSQVGAQAQITGVYQQVAPGEVASKMQLGFQKEASRPLPKGIAHRTMERVESALKEAAKSRDGKTLSFRLDPPQLGQVKVDVSLKDGALHARMVPENAQVATLLREKASELQSTLRRLGLNVETVTVSVGNESGSISYSGGESSLDGKTFQQERNKMPGQEAQVVETTFGNELALQGPATKTVVDDHWVA
jgi:flagellar hook-length control protein FliK